MASAAAAATRCAAVGRLRSRLATSGGASGPARRLFGSIEGASRKKDTARYLDYSSTFGAKGYPQVNARYIPERNTPLPPLGEVSDPIGADEAHWEDEAWDDAELHRAAADHVMLSWTSSGHAKDLPVIVRGDGVYLYDSNGKQYMDWTSQAVCCNFGHNTPEAVVSATVKQLSEAPYVYGGLGMVPVRARLAKLLAEITPGDLSGFLFPSSGAEANEAAIRIARRYTGRAKILTQYRSYHGGTAHALTATGDFRRWFTEAQATGFVKIFNAQPFRFSWGDSDEEASSFALNALAEQIDAEGPDSIAAILLESIVGAGGVLVPPAGYMEGVRALCDRHGILLILDEVMVGFGRTGKMWAFEHFDNVLPDIMTSAKGLTGAVLPMSMVAVRAHIKKFFHDQPLGWGSTYQAHPVALACAYECVKFTVAQKLPERAAELQVVMMDEMQKLKDKHPSVRQGRALGLFGCLDLQDREGRLISRLGKEPPAVLATFRQRLYDYGIISLFRPPLLHCCPPLTIEEAELRDGFARVSRALEELDEAITSPWRRRRRTRHLSDEGP